MVKYTVCIRLCVVVVSGCFRMEHFLRDPVVVRKKSLSNLDAVPVACGYFS